MFPALKLQLHPYRVHVVACIAILAGAALVYAAMRMHAKKRKAGALAETTVLDHGQCCNSATLKVGDKAPTAAEVMELTRAPPSVRSAQSASINTVKQAAAAATTTTTTAADAQASLSAQPVCKAAKQSRHCRPSSSSAVTHCPKKARHSAPTKASTVRKPTAACSPAELGASLFAHGILTQRISSFGCQAGQWVADESILRLLYALCSDKASAYTFGATRYELVACYLDSFTATVDLPDEQRTAPPINPQLILVVHTSAAGTGQHFSSIIVNPKQQLVHAFDTLGRWPDSRVAAVLQSLYPNLDLFGQHYYDICNNTGMVRQSGATCGPWSLWLLVVYVFNYSNCRDKVTDAVDCTKLGGGALQFWQAVTC